MEIDLTVVEKKKIRHLVNETLRLQRHAQVLSSEIASIEADRDGLYADLHDALVDEGYVPPSPITSLSKKLGPSGNWGRKILLNE